MSLQKIHNLFRIIFILLLTGSCSSLFSQVEFSQNPVFGFSYQQDAQQLYPVVKLVQPGSPAFQSGVTAGDRIISLNGTSLSNLALTQIDALIKNSPSEKNTFEFARDNSANYQCTMTKANYITAEYQVFRYTIFLDAQNQPLFDPQNPCIYSTDNCQSGYGYYVYDDRQAFCGELENNNRKEGLYYYLDNGVPCYYLGAFKNNMYEGKGTLRCLSTNKEVMVITGDFIEGAATGQTVIRSGTGNLIYEGGISNWNFNGYGKYYAANGSVIEGTWLNGQPVNTNAGAPSKETPDNSGYSAEDIILADKYRSYGLTEEEIRKMINYLNTPTPVAENTQITSGNNSIDLSELTDWITSENDEMGYKLIESFDMSFSKYQYADCFTGGSDSKRKIFLIVEKNLKDFQLTTLNIEVAYGSNDIGNHDAADEADKHFPFDLILDSDRYLIYNCNVVVNEIHYATTYRWQLQSGDETSHVARVLVYAEK